MKNEKSILIALIAGLGLNTINAQSIKGSDTVLPLSQQEAENYMKKIQKLLLTVTGGGSGVGLSHSWLEQQTLHKLQKLNFRKTKT